jgi:putative molybdopterin biosynthesis protein
VTAIARGELVTYAEAVHAWDAALRAAGGGTRLASETVALIDSVGRVPASVIRTKHACPTYRAAAMDGFAVRSADVASASRGNAVRLALGADAIAIDTGGVVPPEFDAVVPSERAVVDGEAIVLGAPVAFGKNIRLPGEDVPPGAAIGWPGFALRSIDCAALAASGCSDVDVVARPRLIIIPTGDELVPAGSPARPGSVVETNSMMLAAEGRAIGADVLVLPICRDDDRALVAALRDAVKRADVVALLAGSSRGRRDLGADTIAAVGDIVVRGVATRPGRPTILANAGRVAIVDLPGYPVACHASFHAYVLPLLRRLAGVREPHERRARLSESVDVDATADEWRLATVLSAPGSPRAIVAPMPDVGGGLYRLTQADARFHLRRGVQRFGQHAAVPWTPLRDPDAATRALFVGPYDPLIEEAAALGGFRCRWTDDESGQALDEGLADAVGVIVRGEGSGALRKRSAKGTKVLAIGLRREGVAFAAGSAPHAGDSAAAGAEPWAAVAAVAAGHRRSAPCARYIAENYGVRFEEGPPALYAIVWEDRAGHRFPWGIVLAAALGALEESGAKLGWKCVGMPSESSI